MSVKCDCMCFVQCVYPCESYSLLWTVDQAMPPATPPLGVLHDVTLSLDYLPCIECDQEQPLSYRPFVYKFTVSTMQVSECDTCE